MGPYLGLVPKQEDSGESQPQLGISKAGDTMVRKLLVGSAHYILGPFGPDTDLRRYGLEALRAWWEECEEESGGSGGSEAGGVAAPAVGEWRGVRAAAQRDVGTDRGGSLAVQGEEERDRKREDNRHVICCGGAGPKLMKREPESIQEIWQTTTSTALFG